MRYLVVIAAISGFVGVAMGAWVAHGLEGRLDARALARLDTAVRYQLWHTVALIGIAALAALRPAPSLTIAAIGFVVGVVLFSGSLYALAFTGLRGFAIITPVGGLAFLVGWLCLAWYGVQRP